MPSGLRLPSQRSLTIHSVYRATGSRLTYCWTETSCRDWNSNLMSLRIMICPWGLLVQAVFQVRFPGVPRKSKPRFLWVADSAWTSITARVVCWKALETKSYMDLVLCTSGNLNYLVSFVFIDWRSQVLLWKWWDESEHWSLPTLWYSSMRELRHSKIIYTVTPETYPWTIIKVFEKTNNKFERFCLTSLLLRWIMNELTTRLLHLNRDRILSATICELP